MYDIAIIGAGVIGCSIARELSRYALKIVLLEKENDVSQGASKANSGIVHGGYDAKHGTKKAYFSRRGNRLFKTLNDELSFGYLECGSLVLAFDEEEALKLNQIAENGRRNGIDDLRLIDRREILDMEPYVNSEVKKALYCPSAGITSPYELTIALAENAIGNGVELRLKAEVTALARNNDGFSIYVQSEREAAVNVLKSRYVINCAGVYSDRVAQMAGIDDFTITPRRGEYIVLNKNQGHLANRVLFQAPTEKGKGILVTRTYHGNLMLGPNAQEIQDPEAVGTEMKNLEYIVNTARKTVKDFDLRQTLTTFSGIRAASSYHDFLIGETQVERFINVAGIESPGMTSSPAIAKHIGALIYKLEGKLRENPKFNPERRPIIVKKDADFNGEIGHADPKKNIVCRCEAVTEAEIVDAMQRGIPIESLDAIKRRTRAGMGPCQGSFCGPRVAAIIAKEARLSIEEVTPRGQGSSSLPMREGRRFWEQLMHTDK